MVDPQFHKNKGPLTLAHICDVANAHMAGTVPDGAGDMFIYDVAPVNRAEQGQVSFVNTAKFTKALVNCQASAVLVKPNLVDAVPLGTIALVTDMPYRSYALVAQTFYPKTLGDGLVHHGAIVDDTVTIGDAVTIGAGAVIDAGVTLGHHTTIAPNVYIGKNVTIGQACSIGANSTIEYCIMGDDVQVLAGAVIGGRGFGFATDTLDYVDVPQLGRVIIGDHVEIGANTTIDRGTLSDTVIGNHVRIDNLVQIGHNCQLGDNSVMVGKSALAGSTTLGKRVVLWGGASVVGQATVGDDVHIMSHACVTKDVPSNTKVSGFPAYDHSDYMRNQAALRRFIKNHKKKDKK